MAVSALQPGARVESLSISADGKHLALCPNSNVIHMYDAGHTGQAWQHTCTLTDHDQLVSGLHWSCKNQLVSCSHDRNRCQLHFVLSSGVGTSGLDMPQFHCYPLQLRVHQPGWGVEA